ncbi:glycosyltransferase family 4 protein [uncultured Pseudomonas sp.]|uniref:glycosyltransferase family 4 protein n=1 Tax=uncultured Pseudomonas sp. TaxID=114707 RepID=UPI0025DF32BE|nr:glycosyltransferase family 4 protein [uncultured Pseudomonas sp.]
MTFACRELRILWVLPYMPWPVSSGGKTRVYHLLRALAQRGHRITLLAQSKTPADANARAALEPWLERLVILPRRPLRHPRTLAAALFSSCPLLTSVNGFSAVARDTFGELLAQSWDLVHLEHSYGCQPYLPLLKLGRQPWILMEHNLESALGGATYAQLPRMFAGFVHYDQWRYRRWERRVLGAADQVVAVTDDDARQLAQVSGRVVPVVVNAVDTARFASVKPAFGSQRLLFVGNFEYAPNLDAVEWAVREIMPRLWQRFPRARLQICGHAMPEHWPQTFSDLRLEWSGFVPDLRDAQGRAAIFLAPLRQGGGSKLKVIEALAAGLAVVSTRQGASGLAVQPGQELLLADDAAGLATALAELLAQPTRAAALGEAGRTYARARHDWQTAATQLETVYADVLTQWERARCS